MRLQIYVFKQLVFSIALAVAGLATIVLPTIAIQAVNKLGAISLEIVGRYLPLVVAELVPYLLPMAFMLGVVATYGRLAADRELIAMEMAGIHPARLALPGVLLALPLALGTDFLLGQVSPDLKYRQRNLVHNADLSRFVAAMSGTNVLTFGRNVLRSDSAQGNVRKGVGLDMVSDDGELVHIAASEARTEFRDDLLIVHLKDAQILTENANFQSAAPTYTWRLSELFPTSKRDRSKPKYLTSSEMKDALAAGELDAEKAEKYRYEVQRRHALSVTYLLFLLLGLPTGVVLRSSTQLGAFTISIGFAFLYYVLAMRLGKVLAANGAIPAVLAAWATNGIFLVAGLIFFVRALFR